MLELKPLSKVQAIRANFILEDFMPIPKNAVTLLSATGGTGKTRLSLLMADRHIQHTNEKVALWLTEDYAGQIRQSCDEMITMGMMHKDSLESMLLIINEPPQLAKREHGLFKANYESITEIGKDLIMADVKFVVFDPLLAFYGGNENDNSEARVFIQAFAEWAKVSQITTLIIHHMNKDGGTRGATAFHDGVRARYDLDIPRDKDGNADKVLMSQGFRIATLMKDNWGIRKHLWKLTDGQDKITLKIMPPLVIEVPYTEPKPSLGFTL